MFYQQNIYLADYTTFKIGGPVKYFIEIKNIQDLNRAIDFAEKKSLPCFFIGQGSNLLVNDAGFDGIVIKNQANQFKISKNQIIVDSGAFLPDLVNASIKQGLTGLEWAIGIPGTIGGAIKVKASAYGQEINALVEKVEQNQGMILKLILNLKPGNKEESRKLANQYLKQRKQSQPLECASAGCIFKNSSEYHAGKLIDLAGLKKERIGQAMVSEKHANFIINIGKAKAKEVIELINLIKREVFEKEQVELEEEINYLGF